MDETDQAIVRLLQADGRLGHREIAEIVGLSRSAAAGRINRLIESGQVIVRGVVHPAVLDRNSLAHVGLVVRGPAEPVAALIAAREDCPFVSLTSGPHAIVAELRTSSAHELDEALSGLRGLDGVQGVETLSYIEVLRDVVGPVGETDHRIDDVDAALLHVLQSDGRASYVDLAAHVRLTPAGVRRRVLRLLDAGVVRIGALVRQPGRDGQAAMGIGLRVSGDPRDLLEQLGALPQASFLARTLGRYDLILTLRAYDPAEMLHGLEQVRGLDGVTETVSWTHLRVVKETYAFEGLAP
ncbi:Lrp/AsnC family transcriptional regulator [Nocardioides sp. BP30]|uniref:Lrp/AsnC family transcriptional regulator n=1 Tax=Nocardioides sp. BP30 TaxID=3036374 RepID=UPI0024683A33|nr:Lrp/AsnC family transcriptional regulator [Nocardioides sp. BP30]WGL52301.1 Lrp/AsnC family transcriptional regulator [Nocardioides sp. BP30]